MLDGPSNITGLFSLFSRVNNALMAVAPLALKNNRRKYINTRSCDKLLSHVENLLMDVFYVVITEPGYDH